MSDTLIEAVARSAFDDWRERNGLSNDVLPWPDLEQDERDSWVDTTRAAFAAIEAAGYRIVPVVATDAMAEAAWDGYAQRMGKDCTNIYFLGDVIGLAIAAAPKVIP